MGQSFLCGCSQTVVFLCVQIHLSVSLLLIDLDGYHDDVLQQPEQPFIHFCYDLGETVH